ncbi:Z1 domain-containing protein [Hyphomicrobium sp. LHD-15]|uniref:Z1 domain-containing protein n=1 Tax=Hyphomicrobium sp. LHD-15 TaxID=3072142 RepID=UPI00280E3582|nr:Z1 domain-containing protein [Hyphomicrobium sp. LHD-15]MDQ8698168.1 Z1 domain-containing protein [Hyphomicrobium sp. LHD-15]
MSDVLIAAYSAALGAMEAGGPKPLLPRAMLEGSERDAKTDVGLTALSAYLNTASLNDDLRKRLHMAVSRWDISPEGAEWASDTPARSSARRQAIYDRLGLLTHQTIVDQFNDLFPLETDTPVVISDKFEPWYTAERSEKNAFYWPGYIKLLAGKGWSADALAGLDEATTKVVERLTDPYRLEARQAKGLVVGYVQSGKTANFTGVVAKAVDAGYRLIVILTGTIDVLRKQTQRRLDMELLGKENILRGVDPNDPETVAHADYQDDPDWSRFVEFGFLPSTRNFPDIIRLTSRNFDYKSLRAGIVALEFEKSDKSKALVDPANLPSSSARIVVVKKNKAVLKKFVKDLKSIKTPRHEIPALIIDDESDQASVNTSNPSKWKGQLPGSEERTAINKSISDLLTLLPRAQYVGYTATPFANVFIDPGDAFDIFPRDFLISLSRPVGYMGVKNFHDIGNEVDPDDRTVSNSNEAAFVRDLRDGEDWDKKLQESLDAYVLAGALKLYREKTDGETYRHHTMLVHASVQQQEHAELAKQIRDLWKSAGYSSTSGLARLRKLYDGDFLPVCRARAGNYTFPSHFDDLKPHIAGAISRITSHTDPVLVVNGDKEMASEDVDFDKRQVWRILVGGTKLSRGFTVEGLTVSYYRRKTKQADTLMQMGRWFGFRNGYEDLVRLYIGRAEPDGIKTVDLYEAFDAIVRDEEAFRDQLRQYAEMVDGRPQITPKDIPPLVSQHLPWLKPAAKNKMFNAELVVRRSAGSLVIPTGYPVADDLKEHNYRAVLPLLAAASEKVQLLVPTLPNVTATQFDAWIGEVDTDKFLRAIDGIKWITTDYYAPDKAFLHEISGVVRNWTVIVPQTGVAKNRRDLPDVGERVIVERGPKPPSNKLWGEPTDRKHRPAAQFLAGSLADYGDTVLSSRKSPDKGAVLVYPMAPNPAELPAKPEPKDIVLGVAWIAPSHLRSSANEVVQFRAKNSDLANEPIVPAN